MKSSLGELYQLYIELSQTSENEISFCSNFYLEERIAENSIIDLIVHGEIRPTNIHFVGEVDIYKCYSVYTYFPKNEKIRHCSLSIKKEDGSVIGLYEIFNNISGMYQSSY